MDAEPVVRAPGSPAARAFGCRCDPRLNRSGAGAGMTESGQPLYVPAKKCPLHGEPKRAA